MSITADEARAEIMALLDEGGPEFALYAYETLTSQMAIRLFEATNNASLIAFFTSPKSDGSCVLAAPINKPDEFIPLDQALSKLQADMTKQLELYNACYPPVPLN